MTHEQAQELLEAYSLGTLENGEHREVEAHLDECADCRARLRELSEVVALMAESVPQEDSPETLEHRILDRVGSQPASDGPESSVGGWWVRRRLGWFVAAVAAALALIFGVQHSRMSGELERTRGELSSYESQVDKLQADLAAYEDATMLLGEPGMQFIDLAGVDPNPQAFGKVVLDPDRGNAIVYMYELPPTPEGMEYQLWVMREGKPTSAGTFTVANDGSAVLSLESVPDMSEIASFDVTIEPKGGQREPTGMMYLTTPSTMQFDN
ncbi:hypothetical protein GF377_05155 [candidate division GN15 bacterium]|nr:hypothetical protein [candidate division GN15 bacterium]